MEHLELIVFGMLVAVAGLAAIAATIGVPYPILLVLGGLGLGFVPGVPEIELDPELVLLIFLPPLLYGAAFFSSLRDLRANLRPIGLLAIGLVLATMLGIAALGHYVVGLSWPVAFVLGAVVSPTDAVAPAMIVRRHGVPRRVGFVIEGENLTNDWTALVLYRFAVAAVLTGTFSLPEATLEFLLTGIGGIAVGLGAGFAIRAVRRRIDDPPIEITISLLSGYAAYLPAEEIGASGVIAAVTVGIYMGWHTPELTTAVMRIQGVSVWEIATFLLNATLFLLVGLQLPTILDGLAGYATLDLIGYGCLIGAAVILIRVAWVLLATYLPPRLSARARLRDPRPDPKQVAIIAWAGMRGAVALAAALAIPLETESGTPFPDRELLIFLTFCVILATLVFQGLTLGPLIGALGVEADDHDEREETKARLRVSEAAIERLGQVAEEEWVRPDTVERTRAMLEYRRRRFAARADGDDDGGYEERSAAYQRLLRELLVAEREELLRLRNEGAISEQVRRRVERDLDYEESRLEEEA